MRYFTMCFESAILKWIIIFVIIIIIIWLVGCLGLNGPLRQYFSLYRAVSQSEGEIKEK